MKTLSERIAVRPGIKPENTPPSNRAVVLALREDIRQAIMDGWSILAIYQTLHDEGRVAFSYQAFRRHVNRLLLGKTGEEKRRAWTKRKPASASSDSPAQSLAFNAAADKKDLL